MNILRTIKIKKLNDEFDLEDDEFDILFYSLFIGLSTEYVTGCVYHKDSSGYKMFVYSFSSSIQFMWVDREKVWIPLTERFGLSSYTMREYIKLFLLKRLDINVSRLEINPQQLGFYDL